MTQGQDLMLVVAAVFSDKGDLLGMQFHHSCLSQPRPPHTSVSSPLVQLRRAGLGEGGAQAAEEPQCAACPLLHACLCSQQGQRSPWEVSVRALSNGLPYPDLYTCRCKGSCQPQLLRIEVIPALAGPTPPITQWM